MKNIAVRISLLILAAVGTGCAGHSRLVLEASPEGAAYRISRINGTELQSGRTPALLRLDGADGYRAATYRVSLHQDGFDERHVIVEHTMGTWYWGSISLGRGDGVYVVDPATGAVWKMPVDSEFAGGGLNTQGRLEVVTLDGLPEDYRRLLVSQR